MPILSRAAARSAAWPASWDLLAAARQEFHGETVMVDRAPDCGKIRHRETAGSRSGPFEARIDGPNLP